MTFNLDCYPEVCGLNDANPLFGGTLKKSSEKEFKVSSLKRKITKHKETLSRKKTLQDATLQKQFANSVNEGEAQEVSNSSYQNDPPLSHPNVSENEITYFNNERTSATLKKMICGYLTSSESHIQNYDYDGDCDSTNRLTNFDDVDDITYTSKMDFLIELAKAFILYGVPSHRLESQLHRVSKAVDLKSEFFVLPGVIMISFGNESSESSTHLLKVISGYHMAKLSAVNQLCNDIIDGKASCIEGLYTLDSIAESRFGLNRVGLVSNEDVDIENVKKETLRSNSSVPQRKNGFFGAVEQRFCDRYTFLFIFPIMSFTLCILGFSGTWVDSVFSAFLGLVVGLFVALVAKFPKTSSILEFVSAFFIAILTRLFQLYCYKNGICLNVTITQLSGLSMLLPGMSLTFAITEISTKNLITGTVKLFFALFTAMMIGFGLFMGDSIKFLIKIPNQLSCSVSSTAHIPPFW
ncbi:hypothetical protein HK099_005420 [Clydaea vesicula]|uniref:Threonine/serine exporter-like N-terminal domain-containing protein n=1 Tax=Clydaea vesicula TaxID=447962 RepID=A0AAD5Y2T2_9FUNG|nr:hypothetical protein HK099_005420 [Clydaea vesicula]